MDHTLHSHFRDILHNFDLVQLFGYFIRPCSAYSYVQHSERCRTHKTQTTSCIQLNSIGVEARPTRF